MGKKLIIRGADFSANAIVFPNSELQADCAEIFKVGSSIITWGGYLIEKELSNRASVYMLDITGYFNLGCRNIKVNVNNAVYDVVMAIGTSNAPGEWNSYNQNGVIINYDWTNAPSFQAPIDGRCYIFLNFKRTDNADIPSSVVFSDIVTSIELS